jgi:hypothetical protein
MKNRRFTAALPIGAFALMFLLSGCIKDKMTRTYKVYTPVYQTLTQVRKSIVSGPATSISSIGKICVQGNFIFLSEPYKGIHVIDNSDPAQPKNISFINLPGNGDLAIRDNALYADSYGDLVSFDIRDPKNAITKKFITNAFPEHSIYGYNTSMNPDSVMVAVSWTVKDTTITGSPYSYPYIFYTNCNNCSIVPGGPGVPMTATGGNGTTAINGSTTRFSVVNNYLYAVGYSSLNSFDISQPFEAVFANTVQVDWHVETVYPFRDKLFVGTNNGVYLYDISASPAQPTLASQFTHVRGCDPVIADSNYAYVTLNDSSACLGINNELQILNITDFNNPVLVHTYQMNHPNGLARDGNLLFICDGKEGLKIYQGGGAQSLQPLHTFTGAYMIDVVAQNGLAIAFSPNGIYQYDYSDLSNIHLISKL